jgi:hypothetical protein
MPADFMLADLVPANFTPALRFRAMGAHCGGFLPVGRKRTPERTVNARKNDVAGRTGFTEQSSRNSAQHEN